MWGDLIERIDRKYEQVFEQTPPCAEDFLSSDGGKFVERARAFFKAGNLVVDTIEENRNLYNAEMIPAALSLYRHAIELHLKSMRCALAEKISPRLRFGRTHNLVELWEPIESYLSSIGLIFEDGLLHYRVARIVQEFNDLDEYGDRFRYPDSHSPAARNWVGANFSRLKLSVMEVDLLSFGFSELISFGTKSDQL